MADFKLAQPYVLRNEGYYANIEGDQGKETYRGISRVNFPYWEGWPIIDAAKPLKHNEPIISAVLDDLIDTFYKTKFWDTSLLDRVVKQPVAIYYYDFKVTSGSNATKELQRILGLKQDGVFGSITLAMTNGYTSNLLLDLHYARKTYYTAIAIGHNEQFLRGWLARADKLYADLIK